MKGIRLFLVTKEGNKDVCYMELEECECNTNVDYSIMYMSTRNKSGICLIGKFEEKEAIEKQLKEYYRKEVEKEIRQLKNRLKFLEKAKIEVESVFGI